MQLIKTTFKLLLFILLSCYDANAKSQTCPHDVVSSMPSVVPITLTGNICTTCRDERCKGLKNEINKVNFLREPPTFTLVYLLEPKSHHPTLVFWAGDKLGHLKQTRLHNHVSLFNYKADAKANSLKIYCVFAKALV